MHVVLLKSPPPPWFLIVCMNQKNEMFPIPKDVEVWQSLHERDVAQFFSGRGGILAWINLVYLLEEVTIFFLQNPPFLDILVITHIFKKGALSTQQSKVVCIVKFITSAINQGGLWVYANRKDIADISANFWQPLNIYVRCLRKLLKRIFKEQREDLFEQ